ncbi:cytochrome c oxidase assembly factor 7-like [Amphiura filiformis]|uniref:cytochrome c oxidase assembly factor 7-like n=1 Tax=Amphiura filiformis TaxID=82378 RepID=UPI003B21AEB7
MFAVDFKKEEEVKEYIQNLGTEYSYQCYKEKTGEGCYRLGDFFAAMKADFKQAAEAYRKSCDDHDYGKGCQKIGALHMYGKGVEKDQEKALNYFTKGCDGDAAESCLGAAVIHQQGVGPDKIKSIPKAASFLEKGCTRDNANCCFRLSTLYLQGTKGIPKDLSKAGKLSVKSCELGNMYGCFNASRMYKLGDGVEKSEETAKKYEKMGRAIHDAHTAETQTVKFGAKS